MLAIKKVEKMKNILKSYVTLSHTKKSRNILLCLPPYSELINKNTYISLLYISMYDFYNFSFFHLLLNILQKYHN